MVEWDPKKIKKWKKGIDWIKTIINIIIINLKTFLGLNIVKEPFELIWLPPEQIRCIAKNKEDLLFSSKDLKIINMGKIKNGKWDTKEENFNKSALFISIKKKFLEGVKWENTPIYDLAKTRIKEENKHIWTCTSIDDLDNKLDSTEALYKEIKNKGYKTQRELGSLNRYDEIRVAISRDGEALFLEGNHRLAIAKLLDLDKIPVLVSVWHKKFIDEVKKEYPNKDLTPKFLSQFLQTNQD